jgi:cytosine/creatinine deaminase
MLLPATDAFDVLRRQVRPSHVIANGVLVAQTPPSVATLTWPGRPPEEVDFVRGGDAAAARWRAPAEAPA